MDLGFERDVPPQPFTMLHRMHNSDFSNCSLLANGTCKIFDSWVIICGPRGEGKCLFPRETHSGSPSLDSVLSFFFFTHRLSEKCIASLGGSPGTS